MKYILEFTFNDNTKNHYLYDDTLNDATSALLKSELIDNIIDISTNKTISFNNTPLFDNIQLPCSHEDFNKYISNSPDMRVLKLYDYFGKLNECDSVIRNICQNTSLSELVNSLNTDHEYYHNLLQNIGYDIKSLDITYDKSFKSTNLNDLLNVKKYLSDGGKVYYICSHKPYCEIRKTIYSWNEVREKLKRTTIYDFKNKEYLVVYVTGTKLVVDSDEEYNSDNSDGSDIDYNDDGNDDSNKDIYDIYERNDNDDTHEENRYRFTYKYLLHAKSKNNVELIINVEVSIRYYDGSNESTYVTFEHSGDHKIIKKNCSYKPYLKHEFDFANKAKWKNQTKELKKEKITLSKGYCAEEDFILALC